MKPLVNFVAALLFGLAMTWAAAVALERYFAFEAQHGVQGSPVEHAAEYTKPNPLR
jgi:hypothetical protein